ncbi:competence protein CoiA [Alkalicoccus chagannorensis]|uniref:competence protein CoiA n=1 Tax=Alkalicoccus chagannorensis TaxID=427072 RepID=UPI0004027DA3|nr:competence protein CoiA family protein [Alkalicoccus chagannorensis]
MFTALNEKGEQVDASFGSKERVYRCPACGEECHVKGGTEKVRQHFAHVRHTSCTGSRESEAHQKAKQLLASWLSSQGLRPVIEKRIGEKQRADVWFAWKGMSVVFEVQFSALPAGELARRSADYRRKGHVVIWFTAPAEKRVTHERVPSWRAEAFHFFPFLHQWRLLIEKRELQLVYAPVQLSNSSMLTASTNYPMDQSTVDLLFLKTRPRLPNGYFQRVHREYARLLQQKRHAAGTVGPPLPARDRFIECLHRRGLRKQHFPAVAHLPLVDNIVTGNPAEWLQTTVLDYMDAHRIIRIESLLRYIKKQGTVIQRVQHHEDNQIRQFLFSYLDMMEMFGGVVRRYPAVYQVKQTVTWKKTHERLLLDDEHVQETVKKYFESKNI